MNHLVASTVIVAAIAATGACAAGDRAPELIPYLGQRPPGTTPEQFAPGIVNTDHIEINGVFTPDGLGQNDLYISFQLPDGRWSEPANLGPTINSDQTDFCPMVTPDGKFLFFSRRIGGSWAEATEGAIYWADASLIEGFRC